MHIFLSNTVWQGGELVAAVARHMPAGFSWSDIVSGDGKTIATFVSQDIPENVLKKIEKDSDILDHLELQTEDAPLGESDMEKVSKSAKRHGIPVDALPENPKVTDIVEAVKRRMLLAQIIFESGFETSERLERQALDRMVAAGFDISNVDVGDSPEQRVAKVQKHKRKKP